MDFPFERPICSLADALAASHAAHLWHAGSLQGADEVADRLIEIVAFRATRLWEEHHWINSAPGMFLAAPQFSTQRHAKALLVPLFEYPNFATGPILSPRSLTGAPDFFDVATCENLLGSMLLGEVFRYLMSARFGLPTGTSALNHTSSPWPLPPLWQGVDAVLMCMMTPDHRTRRDAKLLEMATDPVSSAPWQRRL